MHQHLQVIRPFPVLFCPFNKIFFKKFLLIDLSLQSRNFFLKYFNSVVLHSLNPIYLLILLLELYFIPLLDIFLNLQHFLIMLHLNPLLIIPQLLNYLSQLLGILILGPLDIPDLLARSLPLLPQLLVVSLQPLNLLLQLLCGCTHLLGLLPLF